MTTKSAVRAFARDHGYRLSSDIWPALDTAVQTVLLRAMKKCGPKKTIRAVEILLSLGEATGPP